MKSESESELLNANIAKCFKMLPLEIAVLL